jgi:acetylornithine deacetylase/succinyl-diaminopimelate desuccinylase-like protein
LIYNDGLTPNNILPIQGVRNNLNTTIPAYFISYTLGIQLANASNNPSVIMNIDVSDAEGVGNICADTPTGNKTKTIVVGSHSDGVPAGSGINDNGKIILIN